MRVVHIFYSVFVISIILTPHIAAAEDGCKGQAVNIIRQSYPDIYEYSERSFFLNGIKSSGGPTITTETIYEDDPQTYDVFCRVWPAFPNLMLVAVPIIKKITDEEASGDLDLLILDTDSLELRHRLLMEDWLQSDAVYITEMSFDTARYQLAPDQMAFGLRISESGSSQVFPYGETRLSLFVIDDRDLRPVLQDVIVRHHNGEYDGNCGRQYSESVYSLAMSPDTHNGFSDIVITGTENISEGFKAANGTCDNRELIEWKSTATLKYDGNIYPYPRHPGTW